MHSLETVLSYHERTKHHLHRYARSLGYMDWSTQPDPFRRFAGCPEIPLPLTGSSLLASYGDLHRPGRIPPRPAGLDSLGALFELALGLSAWKEHRGERWSLRSNPSSGNLHPTEAYLVTAGLPGVPPGVYHYQSHDHLLERRSRAEPPLPAQALLVGLASVHWREAWKYGERAYRYCQHDAGHALAAVRYAAAALGWRARLLEGPGDEDLVRLLGLEDPPRHPGEREDPDLLMLLLPEAVEEDALAAVAREVEGRLGVILAAVEGTFEGVPNLLSKDHHPWPVIEEVARAAAKPRTPWGPATSGPATWGPATWGPAGPAASESGGSFPDAASLFEAEGDRRPAAAVIQTRRSALALDAQTPLSRGAFYRMLARLLPTAGAVPWDALPWTPLIHAGLFVHRVEGLPRGLYLLLRDPAARSRLEPLLKREFAWSRPAGCPEWLPLHLLVEADTLQAAQVISCHQEIAADGAFSLGMLADFEGPLHERGPWWYRRLFWEAGVVGQSLYLESEAAGRRGTGIGCYFDDPFHEVLGLEGRTFQDLYHFTTGFPLEDPRLRAHPPYAHLRR